MHGKSLTEKREETGSKKSKVAEERQPTVEEQILSYHEDQGCKALPKTTVSADYPHGITPVREAMTISHKSIGKQSKKLTIASMTIESRKKEDNNSKKKRHN